MVIRVKGCGGKVGCSGLQRLQTWNLRKPGAQQLWVFCRFQGKYTAIQSGRDWVKFIAGPACHRKESSLSLVSLLPGADNLPFRSVAQEPLN